MAAFEAELSFWLMPTLQAPTYQTVVAATDAPLSRLRTLKRIVLATEPYECSPSYGELQRAVRASAAELRECGSRPEEMVIALKLATSRGALRPATTREDDLHYRMILWGVLEYFRCDS